MFKCATKIYSTYTASAPAAGTAGRGGAGAPRGRGAGGGWRAEVACGCFSSVFHYSLPRLFHCLDAGCWRRCWGALGP
jgi:hypothetical protein